eukprot:TRINITY_DN8245_c0_g1_i5.p1 TRINITY_DN8245_c0_g1~~TRINITY_DN8245_c0_g1_i5.p1  ORF type:complete len:503 (+),score=14.04 TRINITY_DN8245_c0_g1_i5:376-1884(+)
MYGSPHNGRYHSPRRSCQEGYHVPAYVPSPRACSPRGYSPRSGVKCGSWVRLAPRGRLTGVLRDGEVGVVVRVDGGHLAPFKVAGRAGEGWYTAQELEVVREKPEEVMGGSFEQPALSTPPAMVTYTLHVPYGNGIGLSCRNLIGKVVVSSVVPATPAFRAGITPGSFVTRIGHVPIHTVQDIKEAVDIFRSSASSVLTVEVERDPHPTSSLTDPSYEDLVHERIPIISGLRQAQASRRSPRSGSPRHRDPVYYSPPTYTTPPLKQPSPPASKPPSLVALKDPTPPPSKPPSIVPMKTASPPASKPSSVVPTKEPTPPASAVGSNPESKTPPPASVAGSAAKPSVAGSTGQETPELQRVNVEEHNKLRGKHNSPPVTYDPELAKHAQAQADVCLANNTLSHGNNPSEGQNAYFSGFSTPPTHETLVQQACQAWYDEITDYKSAGGGLPGLGLAGHFTQLVWKESTKVGLGIAVNDKSAYVIVNYSPQGNMAVEEDIRANVQE